MNHTMLCDFYELTMANGYLEAGKVNEIAYFDVFFRQISDNGGFAIAAGLEQIASYIESLHFTWNDIAFLKSKSLFSDAFLDYLAEFKFSGDIYAVPEGTPVFPDEPILTVKAPVIEAQFIETFVLLTLNHQSLIATKANRIVRAAKGKAVWEFGSRRAHGADSAIYGARASFIGGCNGTACTISDQLFGVPAAGTMAHSWVQVFDDEYDAFKKYCELYPNSSTLLVDTYNTLESGVPNAIRAFKEVLVPQQIDSFSIRLDSGDIAELACKARQMLDDAGLHQCKIVVSNALDEYKIRELTDANVPIDVFGVGERLITAKSEPVFGGVYKLAAIEKDNRTVPRIKISETVDKITNPHFKKIYRVIDTKRKKAVADILCLHDEPVEQLNLVQLLGLDDDAADVVLPQFEVSELQIPVIQNGLRVCKPISVHEIRAYCASQIELLDDNITSFECTESYRVILSERLSEVKNEMLSR